jgi:phosphonate transport system substrate-binding protein
MPPRQRLSGWTWFAPLWVLACMWVAFLPLLAQAESVYSFAVVPQFEQRKLFAIWRPIIDELQRRSGVKLELVTSLTVVEYDEAMKQGRYDFVYMNPYHIYKFLPTQGYIPLVRDREPIRGVVVVAKDSPILRPEDLQGKTLAVPAFDALGASLMVQADLADLFHVKVRLKDAKTHTSAYYQALNGLADAAGGVQKTLAEQEPSVQKSLRVIYTTRDLPSHPVAALPRVPKAVRDRIQRAWLDMSQDPATRPLLAKIPMRQAIPADLNDYLPVAKLGLDRFWVDQ